MRARDAWTLVALSAILLCETAPVLGQNPTSTCCIPDHGIGCDDPVIETCVCDTDPFCCSNAWDLFCVDEVEFCAPGFCPQIGACCDQSNICNDFVEITQCSASGGTYMGDNTDCQFLTCSEFNEACCFPDGSCVVVDPVECSSLDGSSQGPGTDCASVSCSAAFEACCFPDTNCNDLPPNDCLQLEGSPQGPGSSCSEVFCPGPEEACCLPDGTCQNVTPLDCDFLNGIPQGPDTDCGMVTCPPPPTEACCFSDGNCFDLVVNDCLNFEGIPQGFGSDCQFTVCPLPTIACCFPDESCADVFSSTCFELGGYLFPEDSACSDEGIDCTDCNTNGTPDNIEIAQGSANDINTNAVPDDCEQDLNENGIPDEWEISQGSATDVDTNGIPDIVDILACRYDDMNYNNLPDAIEIAEGSATDANTNGIIDDVEQPSNQRSAIALLRRSRNGTLLADPNGVPQKYANSNGVLLVDGSGNPTLDPNGRKFISWMLDTELADKLADILIDTSGPMPVSRVKDAKIFAQSCHGGGMFDEINNRLGKTVCWVGGSASRGNEVAHCDSDRVADPMGHWVRPLMDAMSNGVPVLQALKRASRDSVSSPFLNTTGLRDQGTYWRGQKPGAENITLEDPTAASHHAVFIAGITDQIGIENEITRFCELLEEQWGNLNTTGTSVHILFGAGRVNPCASNGVPNANVMSAEFDNVCDVLDALVPDLGPNEEFVLFLGDHGLGSETPVNTTAFLAVGEKAAPVIAQTFNVDANTLHGMVRNPDNQAFIRVLASGLYPPNSVSVSVNGRFLAYLSPFAENDDEQNEHQIPLPDRAVHAGANTLTIDLAGTGAIILETEFFTGAMARVPVPGWGDANGDLEVDWADLPAFSNCLNGPNGGYLVPTCYDVDIDLDGDVDLADAKLLQQVFTGGL